MEPRAALVVRRKQCGLVLGLSKYVPSAMLDKRPTIWSAVSEEHV